MSAKNGNASGEVPNDHSHGHGDKGDDNTIAKVVGVAIGTGIAYSLYRSFFVGVKEEDESVDVDGGKSESSKEKICVDKPEAVSEFEADAKVKAGQVKDKAADLKGAADEKGREIKSAIETEGEAAKQWASGKEAKVKEEEKKASGWFRMGRSEAADKKAVVDDKASSALDKMGAELKKDKEFVEAAIVEGEKKLEKAGAAVAGKSSELAHKAMPGGKTKSDESAWSKPKGSKSGSKRDYSIAKGDTLWSISRRYGVTIEELKVANGIWNADYIIAGDTLTIPK